MPPQEGGPHITSWVPVSGLWKLGKGREWISPPEPGELLGLFKPRVGAPQQLRE